MVRIWLRSFGVKLLFLLPHFLLLRFAWLGLVLAGLQRLPAIFITSAWVCTLCRLRGLPLPLLPPGAIIGFWMMLLALRLRLQPPALAVAALRLVPALPLGSAMLILHGLSANASWHIAVCIGSSNLLVLLASLFSLTLLMLLLKLLEEAPVVCKWQRHRIQKLSGMTDEELEGTTVGIGTQKQTRKDKVHPGRTGHLEYECERTVTA